MKTDKQTVLTAAEQAVSNVAAKLAELTILEQKSAELEQEIATLAQSEQEILQSDKSDESKTKKLIEARTRREVKESSLTKLQSTISGSTEESIALGIHADKFLCAIRDALVAARITRVLAELARLFKSSVLLELKRFAQFSLLVDEIEGNGHDRFTWVSTRKDLGLANASKIRAEFNRLVAMADSEADLDIVISPTWLGLEAPAVGPVKNNVVFVA